MKGVLVAIGLAAVVVGAAVYLRDGSEATAKMSPSATKKDAKAGYAPETVLRISPKAAAAPRPPSVALPRSALAMEMTQAKAWKPIYDRLRNTPEGKTPEGLYYLAQILNACANVTDRKEPRRAPPNPEEAKAKFLASVSEKDPNRAARLAAFENTSGSDRCAELRDIAVAEKDIRELREQAAAAGDPKARAAQIASDVFATMKPGPSPGNLPTITDAQLEGLRQAARSGDPGAAQIVGSVLASTMGDMYIRAGPAEQPVDPRAFNDAWLLAACELGASCGPDNRMLSFACAYDARCGADNLRDYFFFYGHSPAQSQNVGEYSQQILNAVRTGDWSYFQFVRGAPPGGGQSVFMFRSPGG